MRSCGQHSTEAIEKQACCTRGSSPYLDRCILPSAARASRLQQNVAGDMLFKLEVQRGCNTRVYEPLSIFVEGNRGISAWCSPDARRWFVKNMRWQP